MKRYIKPETCESVEGRVLRVIEGTYPAAVPTIPERVMGRVCSVARGTHSTGADGKGGFGLERYQLADGNHLDVMVSHTGKGMQIVWGLRSKNGEVVEQGNFHGISPEMTSVKINHIKMAAEAKSYLIDC
jgi:hypothetical protein